MLDLDKIKGLVKTIKSSEYYDGDFGATLNEDSLILSGVSDKNLIFPEDYMLFIKRIGYGELDSTFYMEDGPIKFSTVYGRDQDGIYIIANDLGEYTYAFDAHKRFLVCEFDSSGQMTKELGSFDNFISNILDKIVEMCKWRDKNLQRKIIFEKDKGSEPIFELILKLKRSEIFDNHYQL